MGAENGDSRPPPKTKPRGHVVGQNGSSTNHTRNRALTGAATAMQEGEGKEAERLKKAQYAQELQRQMAEVRGVFNSRELSRKKYRMV